MALQRSFLSRIVWMIFVLTASSLHLAACCFNDTVFCHGSVTLGHGIKPAVGTIFVNHGDEMLVQFVHSLVVYIDFIPWAADVLWEAGVCDISVCRIR